MVWLLKLRKVMIFGIYNMNLCCFTLRWYLWKLLEKKCVCVCQPGIVSLTFVNLMSLFVLLWSRVLQLFLHLFKSTMVFHCAANIFFPARPCMANLQGLINSKPPIIFNIKLRKVALSNNKYQQTYSHSPPPLHLSTSFDRKNIPWQSHTHIYI